MKKDSKLNVIKFVKRFFLMIVTIFLSQILIIWLKINIPLLGNIVGLITITVFVVSIYFSIYFYLYKLFRVHSDINLIIFNMFLILLLSFGLLSSTLITMAEITNTKDFTSTKVKYLIETITKTKEDGRTVIKITYCKNNLHHTVTIPEEKLPDFSISKKESYLEVETFSPLKQTEKGSGGSETVPEEKYKIVEEK